MDRAKNGTHLLRTLLGKEDVLGSGGKTSRSGHGDGSVVRFMIGGQASEQNREYHLHRLNELERASAPSLLGIHQRANSYLEATRSAEEILGVDCHHFEIIQFDVEAEFHEHRSTNKKNTTVRLE